MKYSWLVMIILCLSISPSLAQDNDPTPYDIALEYILEAEANNARQLDLSSLELDNLPPEIGNLSYLEELRLYDNKLTSLPAEIENLSNLYYLNLRNNSFTNLSSEIANLFSLTSLDLSSNQLMTLSDEIGNLTNLRELFLHNNQLMSLPPEIGNLSNLCYLYVPENQLRHLPASLGQLSNLERDNCNLDISDNPLISPPQSVLDDGTPAILAYLRNQAGWHLQRLIISTASAIGGITLIVMALRWRIRRNRKPKQKRG